MPKIPRRKRTPDPLARRSPALWMGPPSYDNGKCFRELFEKPDAWKETRAAIDVLIYADHWLHKQFTDDGAARLVRPTAAVGHQVRPGGRRRQAVGHHGREDLRR